MIRNKKYYVNGEIIMNCLYVYVLTNDTGFAPSVSDKLLSLVCCKGGKSGMRQVIANDFNRKEFDEIWILGVCGKGLAAKNETNYAPIYFAKVDEVVDMKEYFKNTKYRGRKDWESYKVKNDQLESTNVNPHKGNKALIQKDIDGKYAILSRHFIYFGNQCGNKFADFRKVLPGVWEGTKDKAGISSHWRGYIVDRQINKSIDSIFCEYQWFPKDGCKIVSNIGVNQNSYIVNEEIDNETEYKCDSRCL